MNFFQKKICVKYQMQQEKLEWIELSLEIIYMK